MNQLNFGTRTELEHSKTIKKIKSGKYTLKESARLIAKDHLAEDKNYYKKLCKMEGKCRK